MEDARLHSLKRLPDLDVDAAATEGRAFQVASCDRGVDLVVVIGHVGIGGVVVMPDLDAETVWRALGDQVAIHGGEHELVASCAIDGAATLVLRPRAADHQPVIVVAVEVQSAGLETECGLASGLVGAFEVLGNEAEGRTACHALIRLVSARRRHDPAATGHEAGGGIIDDDLAADGAGRSDTAVCHADGDVIEAGDRENGGAGDGLLGSVTTPRMMPLPSHVQSAAWVSVVLMSENSALGLTGVPTASGSCAVIAPSVATAR